MMATYTILFTIMFKYRPQNPISVLSIIAAGVRLYFASFIYTLALAISLGLTALLSTYYFKIQQMNIMLVSIYASFVTMAFVIPLVKRINCIGLGLKVKPGEAFRGFMSDYLRMISLICIYFLINITTHIFIFISAFHLYAHMVTLVTMIVVNLYIILHIYFANLFVILENKSVKAGIVASSAVATRDMWLTAGVLLFMALIYWVLTHSISPYFTGEFLYFNTATIFAVIVGTPLLLCIQIVQYYNLKR